ncbi:hypothetical protein DOTSEDRAFT_29200 [Dothistroma septosporum NZE10]|uniref:DUF7770 domain-containing protein n=1 Tax=Dothistroma septosporum (strain NZE10 / CBS 128990) TaxID=675120 RepID=M2WJ65_DOTSN|nr:hypothetical protein DOTSEDRAFT_29200 [Dothistroma septosporum NZE10]
MSSLQNPYVRIQVQNSDWNKQVSKITIVVHTEGQWESSSLSNNHVTQYLSLAGGGTVQINERHVDEDDINGRFEMVSRNYSYDQSRSMITDFDIPLHPQQRPTVRAIYNIISGGGFNDFCFAPGGMGCRHWHITIVALYEMNGWAIAFSAIGLLDNLSFLYSRAAERVPTSIKPGTFDVDAAQELAQTTWQNMETQVETSLQPMILQRQTLASLSHNLDNNPRLAAQQLQQLQNRGWVLRNSAAVRSSLAAAQRDEAATRARLETIMTVLEEMKRLSEARSEE